MKLCSYEKSAKKTWLHKKKFFQRTLFLQHPRFSEILHINILKNTYVELEYHWIPSNSLANYFNICEPLPNLSTSVNVQPI